MIKAEPDVRVQQLGHHVVSTLVHKYHVARFMLRYLPHVGPALQPKLLYRALTHDTSKFFPDEARGFARTLAHLRVTPYGSTEYYGLLEDLRPVLELHYARNPHHPEHHAEGIISMSWLDRIEMVADWAAATRRHCDGNLDHSISHNAARFGYGRAMQEHLRDIAYHMGVLPNSVTAPR